MAGRLLGAALLALAAMPQAAQAMGCEDLWFARNEIYKAQGYCFKTSRAIRTFGNAGCAYDNVEDVPLSQVQRREIAALQHEEKLLQCPR